MMRMFLLAILLIAAPAVAQTPAAGATDYVLAPGDVIHVQVIDEPSLTGDYKIDTDGTFDYPYLNRVFATGKTPRQLSDDMKAGLIKGEFVLRPQLDVQVQSPRARYVLIVGEVRSPGRYPLTPQMRVLDGVSQAGYYLPSAGARALIVRQPLPPGAAAPGSALGTTPVTIEVNLTALQQGQFDQNIELRENDQLTVLKAEKFYVTGQVKNTGVQTWEPGLTVREALIMAGGIAEKGSSRRIRIIRQVNATDKQGNLVKDRNGRTIKVEKKLDADQTTPVEPDDIIEVQQRLL
jgi:polysaccharide export outer membrane protein